MSRPKPPQVANNFGAISMVNFEPAHDSLARQNGDDISSMTVVSPSNDPNTDHDDSKFNDEGPEFGSNSPSLG